MSERLKRAATAGVVVAAAAAGGAAIGNAASTSSATPKNTTTTAQPPSIPAHGSAAHEDAEKPVTGDAATKAKAAAVKAAGGGTAGAVTTDFHEDGYEVTVTKTDGATIEIHLNSSFNVRQGHDHGGFGGPAHGTAAHENDETPVTGDAATKAKAAAVKAAGGGTAGAVTTDSHGDGYEVTVTKTDGTTVEIDLDSSFNVQQGHDHGGFGH